MSGEQNYRRVLRELEAQLDGTAHNAALQEDTKATLWQLITVLQTDVKKLEQIVAMQTELIELKDARLAGSDLCGRHVGDAEGARWASMIRSGVTD